MIKVGAAKTTWKLNAAILTQPRTGKLFMLALQMLL
jgi:hypothetical protein